MRARLDDRRLVGEIHGDCDGAPSCCGDGRGLAPGFDVVTVGKNYRGAG